MGARILHGWRSRLVVTGEGVAQDAVVATEEGAVAASSVSTEAGTVAGIAVAAPEEEETPEEDQA